MNHWNTILRELERLYELETKARRILHRHVRAVPVKEMSPEEVVLETRLRCAEYDSEITESIASWRWGDDFATISDAAQMWRYVRVHTALLWLSQMEDVPGWHRVFGEPEIGDEQVIRWLLTEWWTIRGVGFRALIEQGL